MISCRIAKTLKDARGPMPLSLDLQIGKGERVALYGPSGAGKTSALRMLAGLMRPDSGRIEVNGACWFDSDTNVVEVAVRRLRAKLDDPFESKLLHTVRGMGYVLEERS